MTGGAAQLADLVVAYPRSSTIPRILALTVTHDRRAHRARQSLAGT
jgi:hypothetical protein